MKDRVNHRFGIVPGPAKRCRVSRSSTPGSGSNTRSSAGPGVRSCGGGRPSGSGVMTVSSRRTTAVWSDGRSPATRSSKPCLRQRVDSVLYHCPRRLHFTRSVRAHAPPTIDQNGERSEHLWLASCPWDALARAQAHIGFCPRLSDALARAPAPFFDNIKI